MTLMMTSLFFDNITRAAAMLVKIPAGEIKKPDLHHGQAGQNAASLVRSPSQS
jgi:hypothetical protein